MKYLFQWSEVKGCWKIHIQVVAAEGKNSTSEMTVWLSHSSVTVCVSIWSAKVPKMGKKHVIHLFFCPLHLRRFKFYVMFHRWRLCHLKNIYFCPGIDRDVGPLHQALHRTLSHDRKGFEVDWLAHKRKDKLIVLATCCTHVSRCAGGFERRLSVKLRADAVRKVVLQKTSCCAARERWARPRPAALYTKTQCRSLIGPFVVQWSAAS